MYQINDTTTQQNNGNGTWKYAYCAKRKILIYTGCADELWLIDKLIKVNLQKIIALKKSTLWWRGQALGAEPGAHARTEEPGHFRKSAHDSGLQGLQSILGDLLIFSL